MRCGLSGGRSIVGWMNHSHYEAASWNLYLIISLVIQIEFLMHFHSDYVLLFDEFA